MKKELVQLCGDYKQMVNQVDNICLSTAKDRQSFFLTHCWNDILYALSQPGILASSTGQEIKEVCDGEYAQRPFSLQSPSIRSSFYSFHFSKDHGECTPVRRVCSYLVSGNT